MTTAEPAPRGPDRPWATLLLVLATGSFAVGEIQTVASIVSSGSMPRLPSFGDAAHLTSYIFILAAVLVLTAKKVVGSFHVSIVVDGLMGIVAAFAFSWYFLLGPLATAHRTTVGGIIESAYALWDLLLVCCVLLIAFQMREPARRRPLALIAAALTILICCDSAYAYEALHGAAFWRILPVVVWAIGFFLLSLAAFFLRENAEAQPQQATDSTPTEMDPRIWRHIMPYLLIPAVVVLMIEVTRTRASEEVAIGVYLAGALLIEFVLVHQVLVYRELVSYANRSTRLANLAAADPVTALPNHRTLVATLDGELERCRRYGRPCSVLFLDLDHFKALNDTFGHSAGDAALREFASVVRSALRAIDILGRWGGEEFLGILPETSIDAAIPVAERVRAAVEEHTFWAAGGTHLTCSIGVAEYPDDARDRSALIEAADQAMYAAKHLGRNQVRRADESAALVEESNTSSTRRDEVALLGMVEALAQLAASRVSRGGNEPTRVAELAVQLAQRLDLDAVEVRRTELAGRLQDIGMASLGDSIFDKPDPLSPDEWESIRSHVEVAVEIIRQVPQLRQLSPVVRAHHEWWDGGGYPLGLKGEAIPIGARILAVADAYIAMTSHRSYRPASTPLAAVTEIERSSGTQFDPTVVKAMTDLQAESGVEGILLLA